MPHLIRPLTVALIATIGDFIWFEFGVRHTAMAGVIHGAVLLLAVGVTLGQAAGRLWRGSLGGIAAGIAGAGAFYAVAGSLGYIGALIAAWSFMWLVLAAINAWLYDELSQPQGWLVRAAVAAVGSGATFYFVAGIWTDRIPDGARNYLWHLVAWTIAWAPGLAALTLRWTDEEVAR